ncbi:malonyl-CoA synthase [uncultured Tateyamaria sp.]|uniref:malonate--CoA ligase n=1 Tax=uncultured Tateyamaria sp. TaxID=455651 RepID=UPI0026119AC0|nr:malonyl-CoA synthase [uncultured Tateyamaria sp.]
MTNHLFDHLIAPHAGNPAPFLVQDGQSDVTYAAFVERTAQMAHRLRQSGLGVGDRVVVQAAKSIEMVILYAATIQAGGVFLPLNTAYTRDEVSYFVNDATPALIVCDGADLAQMREIAAEAQVLTLNADGSGTLTDGLDDMPVQFDTVPRGPDDLAALLYTSGTTGRSKGAMLSHDNLLSNTLALTDLWQITKQDRLIHALPIFHTHGLFVALNTSLQVGATVHFMPGFNIDAVIDALPIGTMMMGVPTFYTRLLSDDRLTADLVAGMRLFVSGSAPLLAETHAAFTERTGHHILERYGMTETNMNTSNPYEGARLPGTVGHPLPGVEVRLTDANGAEVPQGDVGMIEIRGPNVFQGYWQMPEKTAEELRDNGFFITGDLGQVDDQGFLSIVGRQKDLIITGGYNVYPKEIEDVLNDIPGVDESAVVGVPDADFGEAIIAVVVPEMGASVDEDALRSVVADKLARFKHPRRYEVMQDLPRNTMGKVQKNILRQQFDV